MKKRFVGFRFRAECSCRRAAALALATAAFAGTASAADVVWSGGAGPSAGGILYRSFDRTIPSLRALALREGMEDIRYLDCLRRLRGNDPSVRAFLAEAPVKMVANPPGGDRKLADRLREKAIDLILEGLGKPASAEK